MIAVALLERQMKNDHPTIYKNTNMSKTGNSSINDEIVDLLLNKTFLIIILLGLFFRIYLALTTTYIWDEERDWIPAAQSISFSYDTLNLPIRAKFHGALSAYFIKAGTLIFGENAFGFRAANILLGIGTILVVSIIVRIWAGTAAALWAAALLSFNEFHIAFSSIAFQQSSFLFFCSLATLSFVLSMVRENPKWLYGAAAFTGLGFLCYEIAVLLAPVYLITLSFSKYRKWIFTSHSLVSILIFTIIVLPDLYTNYVSKQSGAASYEDHLSRFSGIGFKKYYLVFFFRDVTKFAYDLLGRELLFEGNDYSSMNSIFGFVLFVSICVYSIFFIFKKNYRENEILLFMLSFVWFVFIFFSLLNPSYNPKGLSAQLWIWVGVIIIPAVILAGVLISRLNGPFRQIAIAVCCVAMVYSLFNVLYFRLGKASHQVAFTPEFILPSDGDPVEVRARINFCVLCDETVDFALVDVGILQNDHKSYKSAFDTGDVIEAERGTRDLRFKLRPVIDPDGKLWVGRIYHVTYRIPDFVGNPKLRVGIVRVPRNPSQKYGDVFWTR